MARDYAFWTDLINMFDKQYSVPNNYSANEFGQLYHGRWSIEELYKISKNHIDVEEFHPKTDRGIKQEIYAHALLINLSRVFEHLSNKNNNKNPQTYQTHSNTNKAKAKDNCSNIVQSNNKNKINFKNCLFATSRYVENLVLASVNMLNTWLDTTLNSIARIQQKIRPNRSYPRISHKPSSTRNAYGKYKLV